MRDCISGKIAVLRESFGTKGLEREIAEIYEDSENDVRDLCNPRARSALHVRYSVSLGLITPERRSRPAGNIFCTHTNVYALLAGSLSGSDVDTCAYYGRVVIPSLPVGRRRSWSREGKFSRNVTIVE